MDPQRFDVLVIGAGASGLMAAVELASAGKTVAVIEAKNKIGGRIATLHEKGLTIELGAEFVHGDLPLTKLLLKSAGTETYPVGGSLWEFGKEGLRKQISFIPEAEWLEKKLQNLEEDKTVAAFLQDDLAGETYQGLRASLQNYVEGYFAADLSRASTMALRDELSREEEQQYRPAGGYQALVQVLETECRERGVRFFLSQPVGLIQWQKEAVTAITEHDRFFGRKILVTVSVGVLQNEGLVFSPGLPNLKETVQQLGYGHVKKGVARFHAPFWQQQEFTRGQDMADMSFLFSDRDIPTWWTHFPVADSLLTGWLAGPKAEKNRYLPLEVIKSKMVHSISEVFGLRIEFLRQMLSDIYFYNWSADPHFCGAYSYEVVGGVDLIRKMKQPVEETLFFAGEGYHPGPQIGTVEGALQEGKEAAGRILSWFSS